jgi:DNA-binding winged helix-turn-helix (wHTH) protein
VADFVQRSGRSTVTLMLRLLSRSAESGEIVGHAEIVDTGEIVAVHDVDDLVTLVRRLAD